MSESYTGMNDSGEKYIEIHSLSRHVSLRFSVPGTYRRCERGGLESNENEGKRRRQELSSRLYNEAHTTIQLYIPISAYTEPHCSNFQ